MMLMHLIFLGLGLLMGYLTYDLIYRLEKVSGANYKVHVAFASGLIYMGLYSTFGLSVQTGLSALLISTLLLIFVIDLKTQIIPDELNGFLAAIGIAGFLLSPSMASGLNSIIGAIGGGGFLLLLAIITKGAIGGGDIKMMFSLGLIFGMGGIFAINLMSFLMAAFVSIILMAAKRKGMKDFIPLGPSIVFASVLQLFFGKFLLALIGL